MGEFVERHRLTQSSDTLSATEEPILKVPVPGENLEPRTVDGSGGGHQSRDHCIHLLSWSSVGDVGQALDLPGESPLTLGTQLAGRVVDPTPDIHRQANASMMKFARSVSASRKSAWTAPSTPALMNAFTERRLRAA